MTTGRLSRDLVRRPWQRFLVEGQQCSRLVGMLFQQVHRFAGAADLEGDLDEPCGLGRHDRPETGHAALRPPRSSPQELNGVRLLQTEDLQTVLTGESQIRVQHALIRTIGHQSKQNFLRDPACR